MQQQQQIYFVCFSILISIELREDNNMDNSTNI